MMEEIGWKCVFSDWGWKKKKVNKKPYLPQLKWGQLSIVQ
jgi:hypothetical protein